MSERPKHAPRRLVHRGVVEASAILVDEDLAGLAEARRRVVRAWAPGASVIRVDRSLLVRFPSPRRVDCARSAGLPLVRAGSTPTAPLAPAPLALDELAAASPPPGSIAIVEAGAIAVVVPRDADREDPAAYLDLEMFEEIQVVTLGAPPAPPRVVATPIAAPSRATYGVGAAPAEQAAIAAAIAALREGRAPDARTVDPGDRAASIPFFATLLGAIGGLLAKLFAPRATSNAPALPPRGETKRALAAMPAEPSGPSLVDRFTARMRTLIAEMLVRARLASFIGRKQAEYMGRLMDMLDRGDLTEALRHAIPLGGEAQGPTSPMLGVPSPRSDLSIGLGPSRVGSSMLAATDLYAELRARYRAAFERLEREGRIDEAAFVLAELLHEEAEAVSFLERHDRLRLAAELAEARKLAPGIVVRQWFLAGDAARAIRIARRHGAFADAVARMAKHDRAHELRVLWAETLAEAGDFAAAIEVIWPVTAARRIAGAWIDHAIAQGGALAARMLVKKLSLSPDAFPEVRERALAILADDGPGATLDRRALAEALTTSPRPVHAATLARAAARALAHDGAISGDRVLQGIVAKLVNVAEDAALRADMPSWPTVDRTPLALDTSPRGIEIAAADGGSMEIHDAAHLPNGNTVIALGEAGVRVIARSGKTLFHLDQPAHQLVISDHGDRAIAIAPRGDAMRLARLDLVGRRSEPWCEAPALIGAADFDGATWPVVVNGKLLIVDTLDAGFSALDAIEVHELGAIESIARSPSSCTLVGRLRERCVRARYEVPSWTLRTRGPLDGSLELALGVSAEGAVAALRAPTSNEGFPLTHMDAGSTVREVLFRGLPRKVSLRGTWVVIRGGWIACAFAWDEGLDIRLFDESHLSVRARVSLLGATRASLRLTDGAWTIADDRGRVIVMDLAHGSVIHDLRV